LGKIVIDNLDKQKRIFDMTTSVGTQYRRLCSRAAIIISCLLLLVNNDGVAVRAFTAPSLMPALMGPSASTSHHRRYCNYDKLYSNGMINQQSFPSRMTANSPGRSSTTSASSTRLHSSLSAATTAAAAIAGFKTSLHSNFGYVLTLVLWLSTFGTSLERRTTVGKALSAPLATMALALTAANIGIIPFSSPVYTVVNRFFVPLAVPLLLFDSDLKRVVNDTGTLLAAFCVGAFATVLATIVTFPIVPLTNLGPDVGWRVACALAARHIGGAINFVAVAETLNIGGDAVAAASTYDIDCSIVQQCFTSFGVLSVCLSLRLFVWLFSRRAFFSYPPSIFLLVAVAADNVVVALYFAFLFSISKSGENDSTATESSTANTTTTDSPNDDTDGVEDQKIATISEMAVEDETSPSTITLPTLAISVSVASTLVTAGSFLTKALLPAGTSSLPLISALTVVAATAFPTFFSKLSETGTALGVVFVQMFFACSGAAGSIRMVFEKAPSLFAFSALQIGIHFATLMAIGRGIFKLPKRELYLASNANVGGPTTAAAMAQAKEWKQLIMPALLIGILGYATATVLALSLGPILLRIVK
jgi:uncharacterized membrane protein